MNILDHTDLDYDPQLLGLITTDFVHVSDSLRDAVYEITKRKMTRFPLFIFSNTITSLGVVFFKIGEKNLKYWNVSVSSLEEFVEREIIASDAVEKFKAVYNQAKDQACLLVINDQIHHFVFLPFPQEDFENQD
ncbi:MAG: hypothetical protein EAZ57_07680 [Cytophagales bacterium]|nr:MAG: hypothetical protein EAZ67_08765 [Cytophagales bacterium]TAF60417.1 MAG: hypothetical protein EAZ57_07680 [Cytophagales bacterium]